MAIAWLMYNRHSDSDSYSDATPLQSPPDSESESTLAADDVCQSFAWAW